MIDIDGKIVSLDIFREEFVCDLSQCKGACCVEGDAGAPLTDEEVGTLEDIFEQVRPFMREEGVKAVEEQGTFTIDQDNEPVTALVDGKECAFVTFDEKGITKCSIEQAHAAGAVDFVKPISCHLYPIRISKLSIGEAVNYSRWGICAPACRCGSELKVKVYQFLKKPLIRMYGEEWYLKLEEAAKLLESNSL